MEDIIRDIQQKIAQGRFPSEAAISQGVVLRLLRALDWDVDDVDVVWPEFPLEGQRADFALCYPGQRPVVLVEVKQPGTMGLNAEDQLARYAFRQGVGLVVLTSGEEWHFYAPYGQGRFSDRRIYRLNLTERGAAESASRLRRYLAYASWRNGAAVIAVQDDLREMLGSQETQRQLPQAWHTLLSEPNANLVDLLIAQLEKQTGIEAPRTEVERYLKAKSAGQAPHPTSTPCPRDPNPPKPPTPGESPLQRSDPRLWIDGVEITVANHRDRYVKAVSFLAKVSPGLLETIAESARGKTRAIVATSPAALFPKKPEFADTKDHWRGLPDVPGWYIDVNKSAESMRSQLISACSLVGPAIAARIRLEG